MIMKENIYLQYDFYTVEEKVTERNFLDILEVNKELEKLAKNYIAPIVEALYNSITRGIKINPDELNLVNESEINNQLEKLLVDNELYKKYIQNSFDDNLFKKVSNKFRNRLFGNDRFNNEEYTIQRYVHLWLEKTLAIEISKNERFNSVEIILTLIEKSELLHEFYSTLIKQLPKEFIQQNINDWTKVDVRAENILDSIRTFDNDYFKEYQNRLDLSENLTTWKFIENSVNGSSYAMLNEEYSFKSSVLLKSDISFWIMFWDNLKLPLIQDCIFHSIIEPKQYLIIIKNLISKKEKLKSDLNLLLLIVAKNFFEESLRLSEKLSFYEDEDRTQNKDLNFIEEGKKVNQKWQENKTKYYQEIFIQLKDNLHQKDIEEWIFSYKSRNSVNRNQQQNFYNLEIKTLIDAYKNVFGNLLNFIESQDSFSLQKFNFYTELMNENEETINYESATNILNTLITYIKSESFYWDRSYSEPYWSAMKGIAFLLSKSENPISQARKLINTFKVNHQGWKIVDIDYNLLTKESFIYCGIALLFEHKTLFKNTSDKDNFFKEFLNLVLTQDRFSVIDNSEYYQMPLHLIFLVVNQVCQEMKLHYENELIKNHDDLYSLLSILTSSEDAIENESKHSLEERLKDEFLIEKRKYSNREQKDKVIFLDKALDVLKITI